MTDPNSSAASNSPPIRPEQPKWEVWIKRILATAVVGCAIVITNAPAGSPEARVCGAVVAVGAALGITSRGVQPRRRQAPRAASGARTPTQPPAPVEAAPPG